MSLSRVIVAGGGPAGCIAAYTLARKSIQVTVIERGQPGKDKACGDALIPSALEFLNLLGISQDRIKTLGGRRYAGTDIYDHESLLWQVRNKDTSGWVIPRKIIDREIRDIIGKYAEIQYNTSVKDLIIGPDGGLKLSLRYEDGSIGRDSCDAVIIATGAMNRLSKKFDIHGRPSEAFAISAYAKMRQTDALVFQFIDSCKPGYRWIFPVTEKTANVGVCVLNKERKTNLRSLGEELLKDYNATRLGKWRAGWGPLWSGRGHGWHNPSGIISCGDAAGLINPFNGEGITAALCSGEQAGRAIYNYLTNNRDTLELEKYSHWVNKYFSQKYRLVSSWQIWNDLCGISR